MSRFGAAFLTASLLAATALVHPASAETMAAIPMAAAAPPHHIAHNAAWGCRDKGDVFNLLFLGISASFDDKLAAALADGRCVVFKSGEDVVIVEPGSHGLVKVQRLDASATPVAYWMPARNVN
jgi:hypothetical protein